MVRHLDFSMSGRLLFGKGALARLPDVVTRLGAERPMIVTDQGLVKAGLPARVDAVLADAGISCDVYDGVEPDPRIEIVDLCATRAIEKESDLLIGLGGGSSLDIAKVSASVRVHGGSVPDYLGIGNVPGRGLPTVLMPTTAGTGSEVTPIAVLSDEAAHLKKGVVSEHLYADVALVDPTLTVGLPPHITAYTGIDALTHAIEAYTNKYAQPFVDTLALEAIRLIGIHLRRAVACGEDEDARYHMSLASTYGGMCLGSVNTAAVHALAYPLGGMFHVPHGVANSLLLPYVMDFNLISDLGKFANIALALGEEVEGLSLRDAAARAVDAVRRLCDDVGIVSHIGDLGIPASASDTMADAAMEVTRLLGNNPRAITIDDVRRIYRAAH